MSDKLPTYDAPPYGKWVTNAGSNTLADYRGKLGYKIGPPLPTAQCSIQQLEQWGICGVYRDEPERKEVKS